MNDLGSRNILLVTGMPGVGKTTVIQKLIHSLPARKATGFYTLEIRRKNVRQGFELVTLQGERFLMAHVGIDSRYRVGKYGVDIGAIDAVVAMTLSDDRETEVYILDEIGKMECFSRHFVERVTAILDSGKVVVATVALQGPELVSAVRKRSDVVLWEVTKRNRDALAERVISWTHGKMQQHPSATVM